MLLAFAAGLWTGQRGGAAPDTGPDTGPDLATAAAHLIDHDAAPGFVTDRRGTIRHLNRAAAERFGDKPGAALLAVIGDLLPSADVIDRLRARSTERGVAREEQGVLPMPWTFERRFTDGGVLEAALAEADGDARAFPRRLAIRDGHETACVDVDDIDWIDAAGDYMCVHAAGSTYVLRGTMKHLEEVLNPETFVRVHRSAIVNRHRVTSMRPHRNGEYFLQLGDDTELKLSRKYKKSIERLANRV